MVYCRQPLRRDVGLLDHDVCTGNQWGATRDGRGDAVAIVGETKLWDARCYCWITARRQGIMMWSVNGCTSVGDRSVG